MYEHFDSLLISLEIGLGVIVSPAFFILYTRVSTFLVLLLLDYENVRTPKKRQHYESSQRNPMRFHTIIF